MNSPCLQTQGKKTARTLHRSHSNKKSAPVGIASPGAIRKHLLYPYVAENPRGKGQLLGRWGDSSVSPSAIPTSEWCMLAHEIFQAWCMETPALRDTKHQVWQHCQSWLAAPAWDTANSPCHATTAQQAQPCNGRELALTSSNAFAMLTHLREQHLLLSWVRSSITLQSSDPLLFGNLTFWEKIGCSLADYLCLSSSLLHDPALFA